MFCPSASCIPIAASCSNLCRSTSTNTVLAFIVVSHCMPIDAGAQSPDLQQLALAVFSFLQLAQTLYLHSGWLLLATCTGGLVPSSTCTYTACADCNLHSVVWGAVWVKTHLENGIYKNLDIYYISRCVNIHPDV